MIFYKDKMAENIGINLHDCGVGIGFLNTTPKA